MRASKIVLFDLVSINQLNQPSIKYGAVSGFLPYSTVTSLNSQNVCSVLWDAEIEGKICTIIKNE